VLFQDRGGREAVSIEDSRTESLILAQNERWRRGLGMQVERERDPSGSPPGSLVEWRTGE
jgi:hypothetical protein